MLCSIAVAAWILKIDLKELKRWWQQSVLHWIIVIQRICIPAAESLESSSQRMRDDHETQLLRVCRSTGGARAYVSSLALDILTLTAPSSVTQDRSTARRQTMEIKDVKGQYQMRRHTKAFDLPDKKYFSDCAVLWQKKSPVLLVFKIMVSELWNYNIYNHFCLLLKL